jgi:hypothetical protein
VLVQGERHGAALDLDDPLREPIKRSWEIAQQEYAQAKAALLEACAQVGAAHRAVQEAHQDTLREERHSWLVQNDPEYRSILEQVAEYEQACAETQGKLEQRGNHARNQYLLREVRAAQERKLNAPTH